MLALSLSLLASMLHSPLAEPASVPGAGVIQALALPTDIAASFDVELELGGAPCRLQLQPHEVLSPGARVLHQRSDGALEPVDIGESRTYRGIVDGLAGATVAASRFEDGLRAVIDDPLRATTWYVEPAAAGAGVHRVYRGSDLVLPPDWCGVRGSVSVPPSAGAGLSDAPVLRRLELALDSDYELFLVQGSSVSATANFMLGIANATSAMYEKEVGVVFSVGTLIVRDQVNDPWTDTSGDPVYTLFYQFQSYWNANYGATPRDTAHIITGRFSTSAVGLAYLGTTCNLGSSYALTSAVTSAWGTNWGSTVHIFAHEMGHNTGACHCDGGSGVGACPAPSCANCYVMASFGTCNPQQILGSVSAGQISAFLNAQSCLSSDGTASAVPTLTSLSPAQVTVFEPADVTLNGTALETALNVKVGTARHYVTSFVTQTPTQIAFKPKQGTVIGSTPLTVHGPNGASSALTLEYVATDPPKLSDAGDALPYATLDWSFGGLPGHTAHVLYSTSPAMQQIGPWSVLANAQVLQISTLNGLGLGSFAIDVTPFYGTTFYVQVVTYTGMSLSGASNVDVVPSS
jgi:Metallo-peptidase family M12/IPT/TIG domain